MEFETSELISPISRWKMERVADAASAASASAAGAEPAAAKMDGATAMAARRDHPPPHTAHSFHRILL